MLPDYYGILRISPDASADKIRAAYRRLAKQRHADAGGTSDEFRPVQEAYETLSDPVRRRQYDAQREVPSGRIPVAGEPAFPTAEKLVSSQFPEPLIPLRTARSQPPARVRIGSPLEDFDRLFREFDEFFESLEKEFLESYWGRNE